MTPGRVVTGFAVSTVISLAGWKTRSLTHRGALLATGIGTAIIGGASWQGAVLLGEFFGSSSALSRLERTHDVAGKGSQRDEWQVLANGGVAAISALLAGSLGQARAQAGLAGALAAATADTWATALGSTSRSRPRMLLSGHPAQRGMSGAVTPRGTVATVAGAGVLALTAAMLRGDLPRRRTFATVCLAGTAGSLVDSALGELVQERRYCAACNAWTEATVHRCGNETVHAGGVRGIDNDVVNLACTLAGAILAMIAAPDARPSMAFAGTQPRRNQIRLATRHRTTIGKVSK